MAALNTVFTFCNRQLSLVDLQLRILNGGFAPDYRGPKSARRKTTVSSTSPSAASLVKLRYLKLVEAFVGAGGRLRLQQRKLFCDALAWQAWGELA